MWAQIICVAGTAGATLFYTGILEFTAFEVGEWKWTGHLRHAQWAVGPFWCVFGCAMGLWITRSVRS